MIKNRLSILFELYYSKILDILKITILIDKKDLFEKN